VKPIYEPKGKAKEYGDYALNIYTGCPHRCFYCFAPGVLRRDREIFHNDVRPRENIVEETRKQLESGAFKDKLIHLCFTCDPYPKGYDTSTTREIIKLLKEYGSHVQILTKGDGHRDFDLLDKDDWYGVTIDGSEGPYELRDRLWMLIFAMTAGAHTWISFEPVINAERVIKILRRVGKDVDKVKIGKLNYHSSDINWYRFGHEVEAICKENKVNYYIKESLREEMMKDSNSTGSQEIQRAVRMVVK